MWLSLLTNKYVLMGIAIAVLGAYIFFLRSNLQTCEAEKKTLEAELAVSQASVKGLQLAITEQNSAIEKMKTDADTREKSHQQEITKAKVKADGFRKQAADLLKRTIPQNVSRCDAANIIINEELQRVK
jgi:predicted  nucleic acid-binding Zn-ribbon protein